MAAASPVASDLLLFVGETGHGPNYDLNSLSPFGGSNFKELQETLEPSDCPGLPCSFAIRSLIRDFDGTVPCSFPLKNQKSKTKDIEDSICMGMSLPHGRPRGLPACMRGFFGPPLPTLAEKQQK